ncbi:MAG: sugar nucleotide-binding protein [Planctomycetota bacterium]|nr:sugar nucleotide-binding protein [Planctomycetota bacterium]
MAGERILLVGRGHLGKFLRERLRVDGDLHWIAELAELDEGSLKRMHPSAVVNTAGKTDLRWCEDHPAETFRSNASAPLELYRRIKAACGPEVPFVHLSSGCVWDGPYRADGKPFGPDDPPAPACFYSWTKAAGDAMLLREAPGGALVILRPRQVYSPLKAERNTLSKLARYPQLIDTPNSMTSAETIAKTIERVLAPGGEAARGRILCVYERGVTSPFEVGTFLAQAGLRKKPERISKADLDQTLKPKRVDTVLSDPCFEALVDPPAAQDELKRVIAAYAKA